MSQIERKPIQEDLICTHCAEPVYSKISDNHENLFCCHGCKSVYSILREYELDKYYELRDSEKDLSISRKVQAQSHDYSYFSLFDTIQSIQ